MRLGKNVSFGLLGFKGERTGGDQAVQTWGLGGLFKNVNVPLAKPATGGRPTGLGLGGRIDTAGGLEKKPC